MLLYRAATFLLLNGLILQTGWVCSSCLVAFLPGYGISFAGGPSCCLRLLSIILLIPVVRVAPKIYPCRSFQNEPIPVARSVLFHLTMYDVDTSPATRDTFSLF